MNVVKLVVTPLTSSIHLYIASVTLSESPKKYMTHV